MIFWGSISRLQSISKSAQGLLGSPEESLEKMVVQSSFGGLLQGVKMSISLQRGTNFGPKEGPEMRPKTTEKAVFEAPKQSLKN